MRSLARLAVCCLFLVTLCLYADDEESKPFNKKIVADLDCPGGAVGCKNEKCHFENEMDVTTASGKVTSVTVHWRKSATSQCCSPDRKAKPTSKFTLEYDDGSKVEITPANYGTAWPDGVNWVDEKGVEVGPKPPGAPTNTPPHEPAGFTFDKTRAKHGLKKIDIVYPMDLYCKCLGGGKVGTADWFTSAGFDIDNKEQPISATEKLVKH